MPFSDAYSINGARYSLVVYRDTALIPLLICSNINITNAFVVHTSDVHDEENTLQLKLNIHNLYMNFPLVTYTFDA